MRPRATILLGLMFFGLVFAFMLTNVREHRKAREAWEAKRLFHIEPADVTALSIQQQDAEAVEAVRDADGWRFAGAHSTIPINAPLWDQLAAAMALATNERPIAENDADLAAFELDKPKLSIAVTLKSGESETITFGGLDPTQRHRYARLGDGGVFLARAELFSVLDRPFLDLRDRRMFTILGDGLVRVDYERLPVETDPNTQLTEELKKHTAAIHESYEKNASGQWRMTQPADAYAWQARLDLLERALQALASREYIDKPESLADYGLGTPFSTLTAYGKDGKSQTLMFGWLEDNTENAGLYVKRADQDFIAVVDANILNVVPREPEGFREKRLFTGEAKHLSRLKYRDASSEFELQNDAEKGWHLVGVGAEDTDQTEVSKYLATLKSIEGGPLLQSDVPENFDPARIAIELSYDDSRPASNILIGGPVPGAASDSMQLYARQDFGQVTTISIKEFLMLQADRFRFRVKKFLSFERSLASDVDITLDGVHYHFTQASGRWSVIEPADRRLEAQADLTGFLDALSNTEVTGLIDPAPPASIQGMDVPVLEVTVQIAGPNPQTIGPVRVGSLITPSSRNRFVAISGRDSVYTVDQLLVDKARQCIQSIRAR